MTPIQRVEEVEGCGTCRHHSARERPRVLELTDPEQVGLDFDQMATHDTETEKVFTCYVQSSRPLEIGLVPILARNCNQYTPGSKGSSKADELAKRAMARLERT